MARRPARSTIATVRLLCLSALLIAFPGIAATQPSAAVQALVELTDAVEGIYGDEGARIGSALDRLSRALLDNGSPRPGAGVLGEALDAMPFIPLAAYREGYVRLARGEFEAAIAELRAAALRDPLVADRAARSDDVRRAVAALKEGRLADALRLLEQSEALADSSEARRILGLVHWAASDFDSGIAQLEAAIRFNPRDERSRLALARVLSSADRDADAALALQDAIRVIPSTRAHWWLAMSYERVNRFDDARAEFERAAAAAIAGQGHLYATIGRLASAAADLTGTVDALSRAVKADPANPAWLKLLAGALLHQDRRDDALNEFVKALLIDPADAETNLGIGQIHLDAGRYVEAANALRRATELNASAIDAQYALATALTRLGNSKEAAMYFARVEEAQKQMLEIRRRTLSIDSLKEEAALRASVRDYEAAAALWRQVIAQDPRRPSNHIGLALSLISAGQHEGAIAAYERATTLGADPEVYRALMDLYARVGRTADAARARIRYEAARQENRSPAR